MLYPILAIGGLFIVWRIVTNPGVTSLLEGAGDAVQAITDPEPGSYWDVSGNIDTIINWDDNPYNVPLTQEEQAILDQQAADRAEFESNLNPTLGVGVNQPPLLRLKNAWYGWQPDWPFKHPFSDALREGFNNRHVFRMDSWEPSTLPEKLGAAFERIDRFKIENSTMNDERDHQGDTTGTAYGIRNPRIALSIMMETERRPSNQTKTNISAYEAQVMWGSGSWGLSTEESRQFYDWLSIYNAAKDNPAAKKNWKLRSTSPLPNPSLIWNDNPAVNTVLKANKPLRPVPDLDAIDIDFNVGGI